MLFKCISVHMYLATKQNMQLKERQDGGGLPWARGKWELGAVLEDEYLIFQ